MLNAIHHMTLDLLEANKYQTLLAEEQPKAVPENFEYAVHQGFFPFLN